MPLRVATSNDVCGENTFFFSLSLFLERKRFYDVRCSHTTSNFFRWLVLYSRWNILNSNTIFALPDSLSSTYIRYTRVPSHFQLLAGSSWCSSSPMIEFVLLKFQGDEMLGEGNLCEAFLYAAVTVLGIDVSCNFWRSHCVWILAAGLLNSEERIIERIIQQVTA